MVEFSLIVAQHEIRNVEPRTCTTTTTPISMVLYIICQMTVFLSCPSIELGESVDQVWDKFSTPIVDAIQFFVPMKAVHTRPLKKSKYWPRHI